MSDCSWCPVGLLVSSSLRIAASTWTSRSTSSLPRRLRGPAPHRRRGLGAAEDQFSRLARSAKRAREDGADRLCGVLHSPPVKVCREEPAAEIHLVRGAAENLVVRRKEDDLAVRVDSRGFYAAEVNSVLRRVAGRDTSEKGRPSSQLSVFCP